LSIRPKWFPRGEAGLKVYPRIPTPANSLKTRRVRGPCPAAGPRTELAGTPSNNGHRFCAERLRAACAIDPAVTKRPRSANDRRDRPL